MTQENTEAQTEPGTAVQATEEAGAFPGELTADAFARAQAAFDAQSRGADGEEDGEPADHEPSAEGREAGAEDAEPTEEAAAEAQPAETGEAREDVSARRFAAIRAAQDAIRRDREQLDRMRADLEQQASTIRLDPNHQKALDLLANGGSKLEVLHALGVNYDDLTREVLSGTKTNLELSELRNQQKTEMQQMQDRLRQLEQSNQQSQVKAYLSNVKATVASDSTDRWELLQQVDNYEQEIVDLMEERYKQTGEIIPFQDAADQLEAYMIEEAERYSKAQKVRKRFGLAENQARPPEPQATKHPEHPSEPRRGDNQTLTNDQASEIAARSTYGTTDEECLRRAVARFEEFS